MTSWAAIYLAIGCGVTLVMIGDGAAVRAGYRQEAERNGASEANIALGLTLLFCIGVWPITVAWIVAAIRRGGAKR